MLNDIIKSSDGWDTKALAKICSKKKFRTSVNSDKEEYKNYLVDLVSQSFCGVDSEVVTLPKEIIRDDVTWNAFTFVYNKDPLILPILLRYFTHKKLVQEAKDDLDVINKELQDEMDKDLKGQQNELNKLKGDQDDFSNSTIYSEEFKKITINGINERVHIISSKIEKIEQGKEDIKNFLCGEKVTSMTYINQ